MSTRYAVIQKSVAELLKRPRPGKFERGTKMDQKGSFVFDLEKCCRISFSATKNTSQ